MKIAALVTAIAAAGAGILGQPPNTVRGRVLTMDGGAVANARVAVLTNTIGAPVTLTDDDGRFLLTVLSVTPGLRITVSKTGFARTELPAQTDRDVEVRLERGAVISGRVTDEFGDGVQNARVSVENPAAVAGQRPLRNGGTDDRGEYRIGGLAPGEYRVSVSANGDPVTVRDGNGTAIYPQTIRLYYADSKTPDGAERLSLGAGEERGRVDFVVPGSRSLAPSLVMPIFPLGHPPTAPDGSTATGVIRGQVVTPDQRSVPRAQLRLGAAADVRAMLMIRADADGRFEFSSLPKDQYTIVAGKVGYTQSPPRLVALGDGELQDRVTILLRPWGSVAGVIKDDRGDPLQGAAVQLLRVQVEAGRRRLVPANLASALTDDLGRYRVHDVPPGRFVITASVSGVTSAELPGYARAFYPGTPNAAQAQFVAVGESQDVPGIDLALTRTRTARVSGTIVDSSGVPNAGGNVALLPQQSATSVTYIGAGARIDPDGQFEFTNVAPGQYVVRASRGRLGRWREGEFGTIPVSVNGADVTGLRLQTSAGSSIQGRFTFDPPDPSKRPAQSRVELSPIPVDADLSPPQAAIAEIHDDWTFEMRGINGPRRLELIRVPEDWSLREIRVNGVDATDRVIALGRENQSLTDVEVILSNRVSELTVTADTRDGAARASHVVVFSTDRGRRYPRSRFMRARAAQPDGSFRITGLPFGTYYVAALAGLPDEGEDGWQDPGFLENLSRSAQTVTIREGEKQAVKVQLPER